MVRNALILLAALAVPAVAQAPQMPKTAPGAPDAKRVQAGTYKVDPNHTQVLFEINHLGFSEYSGMFVEPSGTLTLDPAHPAAAKVDIAFPIAKVRTTVAGLDAHLQTPDFFDAAKFPEGRFVSTRIVATGTTATISGDLTIHGVTKPVTLNARFIGAGTMAMGGPAKLNIGFQATTTIKRSDWGMSMGIPLVGDTVKLTINAAFAKEG
ncbi:Lipid/polyisoprenoid-binding YceI-like domain-containing protein [Sphingomonas antarctica]|uniref:YceI family protein n=1 Tax=Sphingomonas antarctica TaxID=2040274 RepID=UPI0039E7890A